MDKAEKAREKRLRDTGRITPQEWELIYQFQGGVCFICGGKQKSGIRLALDHRHACGTLRGLLCGSCNGLLGKFENAYARGGYSHPPIFIIKRLLVYLEKHPATEALGRVVYGYKGRWGTKKHRKAILKNKICSTT